MKTQSDPPTASNAEPGPKKKWVESVLARVDAMKPLPKVVICDLSTSPNIDMAGAHFFLSLYAELEKRGIVFRIVEARSKVRDMLRLEGVEEKVGRIDRFTTLADAIDDFLSKTAYT